MQLRITALVLLFSIVVTNILTSQVQKNLRHSIQWMEKTNDFSNKIYYSFKGGIINDINPDIDLFTQSIEVSGDNAAQAEIITFNTNVLQSGRISPDNITERIQISAEVIEVRKKHFLNISFLPVRKLNSDNYELLVDFEIKITLTPKDGKGLRGPLGTTRSVLADGDVYRIEVDKTGIYRIDRTFLETRLGIDVSKINPRHIKLYGNGGGMLPESNASERPDDLTENRIYIEGEQDGRFDNNDYILFYGEGPDKWKMNTTESEYLFEKNIYDTKNYYFLKISESNGLRISNNSIPSQPAQIEMNTFDFPQRFEADKINLLGAQAGTYGTGKEWYGDSFRTTRDRNYTSEFNFNDLDISQDINVKMLFAGRAAVSSKVILTIGERNLERTISSVNVSNLESTYAQKITLSENIKISNANPSVRLQYPNVSSESDGWIDYIQITGKHFLKLTTNQKAFRNIDASKVNVAAFNLQGYSGQLIWDITEPYAPSGVIAQDNKIIFETKGKNREFIAFSLSSGMFSPLSGGKIANQNLHDISDEDMLVVYHSAFAPAVEKFINHRQSHSGLKIRGAEMSQVYNEFSSGKTDPSAIRDMARLLLQRNPQFKYLLLFGDGSYDYKNLMPNIKNENFVPVYQTDQSLNSISGFPSDDYFGLLGDNEGVGLKGGLDLYVGRFPVKTIQEAEVAVAKIVHYDNSPDNFGDWRLRTGYAADDEDFNTHVRDMDDIARESEIRDDNYNQQKIYFDAFRQISTSGENRYPDANRLLNDNIIKGQVTLTYLGHGGFNGWAQERVLTVTDIQKWNNYNSMALLITATCSFAAYDDPAITSPAEFAFLNPNGGAIALFSTTRPVFTSSNKQLTSAVHELVFKKENGAAPRLGQILSDGKNKYQSDFFIENSRKFTLIGDPSMQIAMPKYDIITSKINGRQTNNQTDTLRALSKVTIEGFIADTDGSVLESFNGTIFPTLYDKKARLQTLGNDATSPIFGFDVFRNIIFKGSASVKNGLWSFSFYVPKDINYTIGSGRLSLYATDEQKTDAGGVFTGFSIGGSGEGLLANDIPPDVELFMNDENFVHGGMTNQNPLLIANLSDDFGINVTGNAIGHDITAIIDDDNQNIIILNEFFQSTKDDFRSGVVKYPLSNLTKGQHNIRLKAWDISNNSTEKRIDFIVSDNSDDNLKHVLNYPNPFTTFTKFNFEHDLANTELDVQINIYSISGKLVKTISDTRFTTGFRINDIPWDGRDDYESKLAKGVYLYKVKVTSKDLNLSRESSFEKLIIL
ncbi:MAG: type IX secretion system sortase PorU [Saprospiraceae bacterium]|nr:type IX secretion system sortase PorU [Saprospiraceae bacterium]